MKKIVSITTLALLSLSSHAEGWIDQTIDSTPQKLYFQGWACDPNQPNVTGWVHFTAWGHFLGALPANQERPDVAGVCGGTTMHGYSGWIDVPASSANNLLNGSTTYRKRDVDVELVMDNFTPNVDRGLVKGVKIWHPSYFEYAYASFGDCNFNVDQYASSPAWAFTQTSVPANVIACPVYPSNTTRPILRKRYVNIGDPVIPKGSQVNVCDSPENSAKLISNGWSIISRFSPGNNCVHSFVETIMNGNKTYTNIGQYQYLTIQKN